MKKILLLLLISVVAYAQPQVFNVQHYCVDRAPFQKNQCDISGNEYSFVFLDAKKRQVTFFFTDTRLKYTIASVENDAKPGGVTTYNLTGEKGVLQMKVNRQNTKIEFLYPDTHIYLTVGKSTKMQ